MKKLLMSIFFMMIVVLLPGCSYDNVSSENFVTKTIKITNRLDEHYKVEYTERNGFPDQQMDVKIYNAEQCIAKYTTEYENKYIPNRILYLFSTNDCDYFFLSNENADYVFWYDKSTITTKNNIIIISVEKSKIEKVDEYAELSKKMKRHIDKQTLIDKFEICEYDSTDIIILYELVD